MKGEADEPFPDEPSSSRHRLVCPANRYGDDGRSGLEGKKEAASPERLEDSVGDKVILIYPRGQPLETRPF